MSRGVLGHNAFRQEEDHCTHLASPALHHNLGHVDDASHRFYVLSFPALDGFGKDLQLELFPLPQLLALCLEMARGGFISQEGRSKLKPSQQRWFHQQRSHNHTGSGLVMSRDRENLLGFYYTELVTDLVIYEVTNT